MITFVDLGLADGTQRLVSSSVSSVNDLIHLTKDKVLAIPGVKHRHLREIRDQLRELGLSLMKTPCAKIVGRPSGSRDKNSDSVARSIAGRKNAWKNGNGSKRTDVDRFTVESIKVDAKDVEKYRKLWRDAIMKGNHVELEADIADTMGLNYALYKTLGRRFLERGSVDIPLYAYDRDGNVMCDSAGNELLLGLKTPKGDLDVFLSLQRALGIHATDLNVTAKSQGRLRKGSEKGALGEIEEAKSELEANRARFLMKQREKQREKAEG